MLYECNDVGEAPRDAVVALAGLLNSANRIAFLTGAGVSTDSGIPDFRSSTGVYQTTSAEIFAIDSFFEDPERFYSFFAPFYRDTIAARPNSGHLAIAALEKLCNKNVEVVTQNIDALHSAAGSSVVWEIHGTLRFASCMRCGKRYERDAFQDDMLAGRAPKCACGGVLKPDVVFFGEGLPDREFAGAQRAMWGANLLIVAGTSLAVYPAAGLPRECDADAPFVVLNKTPTPLDYQATLVCRAPISATLPYAVALLAKSQKEGIAIDQVAVDRNELDPIVASWENF